MEALIYLGAAKKGDVSRAGAVANILRTVYTNTRGPESDKFRRQGFRERIKQAISSGLQIDPRGLNMLQGAPKKRADGS
jgi:hypothetical protein